jgi:hypothetical protein
MSANVLTPEVLRKAMNFLKRAAVPKYPEKLQVQTLCQMDDVLDRRNELLQYSSYDDCVRQIMDQSERERYTTQPKPRAMYIIYIDDRRFEAFKNGDEYANSAAGSDLLALFNDILSNAGDPNARVQFVEKQPPDDPKPFVNENNPNFDWDALRELRKKQ